MSGSTTMIVVAVLVLLAVLALAVLVAAGVRNRRSQQLRSRFGPEYDRTVESTGSRQVAERTLQGRVERRRDLEISELDAPARQRYAGEWRSVQGRFVDDPRGALGEADRLIVVVMQARGYPADDFEQQAADVSVDHAGVVPAYRRAREVFMASDREGAATDELRLAMVHYRELFEELIGEPVGPSAGQPQEAPDMAAHEARRGQEMA